jgi:ribosomal protein S18 acetylase RimI-like enzyme
MIIRAAGFDDLPAISGLATEIWWDTYKGIISDEQIGFMLENLYSQESLRNRFSKGMVFLIAEDNTGTFGFAEYSVTPEEKIFKIHKLYIIPSEKGMGTGTKFLEHITALIKRQGGDTLEVNVNRGNPAVNFYKKLGFEIFETVDIPYYQFVLNDYVMRKKIS